MANRKRNRRRNRYREMESIMTKVLIVDALIFCLYMFAASRVGAWETIKIIAAALTFVITGLSIAWLFLTKELGQRRSLWMATACVSILACLLVSICLHFPCPPIVSVVAR